MIWLLVCVELLVLVCVCRFVVAARCSNVCFDFVGWTLFMRVFLLFVLLVMFCVVCVLFVLWRVCCCLLCLVLFGA